MEFRPSLLQREDFWEEPLLDDLQMEIAKICFLLRMGFNLLCVKNINGSRKLFLYFCQFRHDVLEFYLSGINEWLEPDFHIFDNKWLQRSANPTKYLTLVRFGLK